MSCSLLNESGSDGLVGAGVDQDERARAGMILIVVQHQRVPTDQTDAANIIQGQGVGCLLLLQAVYVAQGMYRLHLGLRQPCSLFEPVGTGGVESLLVQPT